MRRIPNADVVKAERTPASPAIGRALPSRKKGRYASTCARTVSKSATASPAASEAVDGDEGSGKLSVTRRHGRIGAGSAKFCVETILYKTRSSGVFPATLVSSALAEAPTSSSVRTLKGYEETERDLKTHRSGANATLATFVSPNSGRSVTKKGVPLTPSTPSIYSVRVTTLHEHTCGRGFGGQPRMGRKKGKSEAQIFVFVAAKSILSHTSEVFSNPAGGGIGSPVTAWEASLMAYTARKYHIRPLAVVALLATTSPAL